MKLTSIEDPRSPLEKARRSELRTYLKNAGIQMDYYMSAEAMRAIMRDRGFDIRRPIKVQTIHNTVEKEDINNMSRPELMRLAKAKNIPVSRSDNITKLIEKINGQNIT